MSEVQRLKDSTQHQWLLVLCCSPHDFLSANVRRTMAISALGTSNCNLQSSSRLGFEAKLWFAADSRSEAETGSRLPAERAQRGKLVEANGGRPSDISIYGQDGPSAAETDEVKSLRHGDTVLSTVRPERDSYFLVLNPPDNRIASTGFAAWSFVHAAMTQPDVCKHLDEPADGGAYPTIRPEIIGAWESRSAQRAEDSGRLSSNLRVAHELLCVPCGKLRRYAG